MNCSHCKRKVQTYPPEDRCIPCYPLGKRHPIKFRPTKRPENPEWKKERRRKR